MKKQRSEMTPDELERENQLADLRLKDLRAELLQLKIDASQPVQYDPSIFDLNNGF